MPVYPNLIIAGAPKCGTSSLYRYLGQHPQVCAANVAECRYLIDRDYPLYVDGRNYGDSGLEGYAQFFPGMDPARHRYALDATPDYLYQSVAIRAIEAMPRRPRLVFLLREPARRIYSLYRFAQNNIGVIGPELSFAEFVDHVREGKFPQRRTILREAIRHSDYASYLSGWRNALGMDDITILLFEDMVRDPRGVLNALAAQLGISPEFYDAYEFGVENPTVTVRNRGLHRARRWVRRHRWATSLLGPLRERVKAAVEKQAVDPRKPGSSASDARVIAELKAEFAGPNRRLVEMTGVDLSGWD